MPGGPTVLSERMPAARSVALGFWIQRGGAHDEPGREGLSHLLEHLVFKGSATRSARDLAAAVEDVGGSLDAYTAREHTGFTVRVPSAHLGTAVEILAELVFRPALRPGELEAERKVVLEEIAGVREDPSDLVHELHDRFLYGDHPYGSPILGSVDSVASLGPEDLRAVHARDYVRHRTLVAAAGRLHHGELLELLDRRLSGIAGGNPAPGTEGAEGGGAPGSPARPGEEAPLPDPVRFGRGRRRVDRPEGRQVHMVAGWPTVPRSHPLRHAVLLVETVFGGGMSSRLFQRIREERGLAYAVYSYTSFYRRAGHAGVYLATGPKTAGDARGLLLEEAERLATGGLEEAELAAARRRVVGSLEVALDAPAARAGRLAERALHGLPYETPEETAARIASVTPSETARAARLFHPDRAAVLELGPDVAPAVAPAAGAG